MIRGRSPPKHRHDGTSPLPMGMDWSPPPKKWNGRDTVWPHDPRSGWSYCVTIPSWVALPKSRSSASDPVVFYRVQVGIQSPESVTTIRGVLRRFNDFLKLYVDLKKTFPRKTLPSAPPKGLLRMKSRALLEERRCSLEDWMSKLLSDIDISRSMAVASFLELEAAARSSFQDSSQPPSETNPSPSSSLSSGQVLSALAGSSSVASDYGSDTAYETSELGSPSFGRDDGSEVGVDELTLDEDLSDPAEKLIKYSMSNIDEGLLMGESILDQLEAFKQHKVNSRQITGNGRASRSVTLGTDDVGSFLEAEGGKVVNHKRNPSSESVGSDLSSHRGSEVSNPWTANFLGESSLDASASRTMGSPVTPELQLLNGGQIALPRDQQLKLDRILIIMQRRLVTAKTDMEDLIARLNQEVAVKEYLGTKVKDLEVELETTREKCKETLEQALSLEKDRVTKMQWDMEELRHKSLELELKLKSQQDGKLPDDSPGSSAFPGKDELLYEVETTREQLNFFQKQREELEIQSKSDIKVLVKEVKTLRRSQNELMQKLEESLQEKSEMEQLLQMEKERSEQALAAKSKLLHDCQALQSRLQECNIKFVQTDFATNSSSVPAVFDLLAESDKQLGVLLAEAQLLAPEVDTISDDNDDTLKKIDRKLRLLLRDIYLNNAKLREQVNIFIRSALQLDSSTSEGGKDGQFREIVLKQLLNT